MAKNPLVAQQRLLKMVDEIDDYAIILLDEFGNVESWNKGAERIKGYKATEIIGQNFKVFYTPEDRVANLPIRLIQHASENEKITDEGWRVRKDGTKFWGSILITAIHDDKGLVIGFTKIMRDLTAIKISSDSLRKSEERYIKMISEVSDYAIILLDVNGNVENWNKGAENIKGYSPEEIIGKNFKVFYSQEDQLNRVPESLISEAIHNGKAQSEGWRIRKDGSRFWGLITITCLHDHIGTVIGFSKVTRDLTEKKLAEKAQLKYIQELDRKNKELEQFTYIASHDLQEPLRTITSFNGLFREMYGAGLDENANMFIDMIEQSATRMTNLIHGLLDYSRIGVKRPISDINLNLVMANIEVDFFQLIQETDTKIHHGELPDIRGFETEIIQLFQNVVSNAIKYRDKQRNPEIFIDFEEDAAKWTFSIKDNGIGMDPKYMHKIFLIFQRLHNRDEYQGSGIGLANCKKITELHNGDIWAESVPGEGSTFYFTISKNIKQ